jgi:hypothetical protein
VIVYLADKGSSRAGSLKKIKLPPWLDGSP